VQVSRKFAFGLEADKKQNSHDFWTEKK